MFPRCVLCSWQSPKIILRSRGWKRREVKSKKVPRFNLPLKKLQFSSQNESMYATQRSKFCKQTKCFFLDCKRKLIHKNVVSDFWKYIESIDVSSWKLGDIHWIFLRESLQNWHSDPSCHNLAGLFFWDKGDITTDSW